jgi:hypothetical protein
MTKLDLTVCEQTIETLILSFLSNNPTFVIDNGEIEWETLSMEGALLIRVYCEYCYGALVS